MRIWRGMQNCIKTETKTLFETCRLKNIRPLNYIYINYCLMNYIFTTFVYKKN